MKRKQLDLCYVLFGILLLFSCKEADYTTYKQPSNIYFDLTQAQRDSIVYTFAYDMTKALDTVFIPIRQMGHRQTNERYYKAYVQTDSSTAREGLHYKVLESQYPLLASQGRDSLPIIFYNVAELEEKSVSLIVKLQESADFGIENPRIIRARVVVSARLEKPLWWDMWLSSYSRVKHQLFLIVTEQRSLTMVGLDAPKNLYIVSLLTMMLNNPFKWVEDNPDKGYVLTTTDQGVTYDFYHKDNPGRAMKLRYNAGVGKFFFIDELGREVS